MSKIVFTFISEMDTTAHRNLGDHCFSFSTLKVVLLNSLLAFIHFNEKFAIILIFVLLYLYLIFWLFLSFFFITNFKKYDYDVDWCSFFVLLRVRWVSKKCDFILFIKFGKILSICFQNFYPIPFSPFLEFSYACISTLDSNLLIFFFPLSFVSF